MKKNATMSPCGVLWLRGTDMATVESLKDRWGTFMVRLAGFILLGILSVGWSVPASAQPRASGSSQSRDVRKAQKKQAKAQKKYAKAQKKAERKMLKTERKNTKYPSRQF
jgi:hypothetical protein